MQIYVTSIGPFKCREEMECGGADNFHLSGRTVNSEKQVIMWMHLGKDQYDNVHEIWEPSESLSPGQKAFDCFLIFLLKRGKLIWKNCNLNISDN